MKIKLSPLVSDILISVYIVVTLFFRFLYQNYYDVGPGLSLVLGVAFIAILWVLIKAKILNPNYFGLFNKRKK